MFTSQCGTWIPARHSKDAPVDMAETCKEGVGFGSSLSPRCLVHQLLHLGKDLLLLPPDTALQPLPMPCDSCEASPGALHGPASICPTLGTISEKNTYSWEMPRHTVPHHSRKDDGHPMRHQKCCSPSLPYLRTPRLCCFPAFSSFSASPPSPSSPSESLSTTFPCNSFINFQAL